MVKKYQFGLPFETEAVVEKIETESEVPCHPHGKIILEKCSDSEEKETFYFCYVLEKEDIVYGLGENVRGINKRGHRYVSNNVDEGGHSETKQSLYGAHNFLIIAGKETVGFFFDYPGKMKFDVGYSRSDELVVTCDEANLYLYVITGGNAYDITRQFRRIIGESYIPPLFAFGYGQSRYGYECKQDIEEVVQGYRERQIPLDMMYLDIDYMDDYKDFTIHPERFSRFPEFAKDMKQRHVHLIPIMDAGVKVEQGDATYEEGMEHGYFCKKADGTPFTAAVWPGWTHFPDVLNKEAREWFGGRYASLVELGVDGFWNDMNEPAIFFTPEGLEIWKETIREKILAMESETRGVEDLPKIDNELLFRLYDAMGELQNNPKDYAAMYHEVNGKKVRHDTVHNLYGYYLTRGTAEAVKKLCPKREILLFSRSSYIGLHRYAGIWTGDNSSWWSHLLLNLKMLPSLNMCGFLYVGADLGGFGDDTTRDLLLRWLALGVFTPLMRNHSGKGSRDQECYRFEQVEDFRHIIEVRYRLVPYLYAEYKRAAKENDMMFVPLGFFYPEDRMACQTEDQLFLGKELMIAPVYTQNAEGRYVYLPEEMMFVKFLPGGKLYTEILSKGHHYVNVALNEVPLFIRKGKKISLAQPAQSTEEIDFEHLEEIGYV